MFIDDPGLSVLAIDPGGTTGIAVWDAWTSCLYVDQIDSGRGRRAVEHVHAGVVESVARRAAVRKMGSENEYAVIRMVESGVVGVLCDLALAMGPRSVVICEDFVLRADMPVRSGKREGLSPVRIGTRLDERMTSVGLLNGDAWRAWDVFKFRGADKRGVSVRDVSGVAMPYPSRVVRAEKWRLAGYGLGEGAGWAGGGCKFLMKMPSSRLFIGGNEKRTVAWLREQGLWLGGCPHGMDALEHLLAFTRRLGVEIHSKPERVWHSAARPGKSA